MSTLRPGAPRRVKENVAELPGLHVDVDFKDIEASPSEIEAALARLPLQPQRINASGHGLHCYWFFPKALPATLDNIARVEAALKTLADVLAGDPTVCHVASLMRLPGSHNSKRGEWIEVTTVAACEGSYTIEELEAWLATAAPVLRRLPAENKSNSHDPDNPWTALAEEQGFKPLVDVGRRLAEMRHRGPGESAIHLTQLSVTAALLNSGTPIDAVVARVLAATRDAAGAEGAQWDWTGEERDLRAMCDSWIAKHPEITATGGAGADTADAGVNDAETKTAEDRRREKSTDEPEAETGKTDENSKAAPRVACKQKPGRATIAMVIADGAIKALRQSGRDLLLTGGGLYIYREGILDGRDRCRRATSQGAVAPGG